MHRITVAFAALLLAVAAADTGAQTVVAGGHVLRHGQYLDLDRQAVGSHPAGAELRLLFGGSQRARVLFSAGVRWGRLAADDLYAEAAGGVELATGGALALPPGRPVALLVIGDRGCPARLRLRVPERRWTPHAIEATFRVSTVPEGRFEAPPADVRVALDGTTATLRWRGPADGVYSVWRADERGAWGAPTDVAAPRYTVDGLTPGRPQRLRVARKHGPELWSEARTLAVCAGTASVERGEVQRRDVRKGPSGLALGEVASGLTLLRDGLVALAPAGVQRIGHGAAAYRELTVLPTSGYLPEWRRIEEGAVLAVRLSDGRLAKLLYRRRHWYAVDLQFALLARGGYQFPTAPALRPGRFDPRRGMPLTIDGPALQDGSLYRVHRVRAGGTLRRLGETAAPRFVDGEASPRSLLRYALTVRRPDGSETKPSYLVADSFPAGWQRGRFSLRSTGGGRMPRAEGFDFARRTAVPVAQADLAVTGSAGGMSSVTLDCPHGGLGGRWRRQQGRWTQTAEGLPPFGELAGVDLNALRSRLEPGTLSSDRDSAPNATFWVRTAAGGLAQVRQLAPKRHRAQFEYLLIPAPDWPARIRALKAAAVVPTAAEQRTIDALIRRLKSSGASDRMLAERQLKAFGRKAITGLLQEHQMTTDTRLKARAGRLLEWLHEQLGPARAGG